MELEHEVLYGKVLVTNSKKLCVNLPRDLLVYKKNVILTEAIIQLHDLTLSDEREKSDLVLFFKCIHDINGMSLGELAISPSMNNERSGQFRLQVDRPHTKTISSLFKY